MPLTRTALVWTLSAVAATAVLVTGGAVWALATSAPTGGGTAGGSSSHASAPGSVPPLYTGDELEWFLLPEDQLTSLLGATDIKPGEAIYRFGPEYFSYSTSPAQCKEIVTSSVVDDSIGVRRSSWLGGSASVMGGSMTVLQFASPEQASDWAAKTLDVLPGCATFTATYGSGGSTPDTVSTPVEATGDDARAVVFDHGTFSATSAVGILTAIVVHGNLVATISVDHRGSIDVDQKRLADALIAQAKVAHEKLTQELG